MRRAAIVLALGLLLSACGGPKVPLQIVGKAVPVNVKFGNPVPPTTIKRVPGGYIIIPRPIPPDPLDPFPFPPPPPPPVECPKASPLAQPAVQAEPEVLETPAGATYLYRATRKLGAQKSGTPLFEIRQVGNTQKTQDPVTQHPIVAFDVTSTSSVEASITSFYADSRQLAISGIQWIKGLEKKVFAPLTPLEILPIPPQQTLILTNPQPTWQSTATDPSSQISATVDGKVLGRERVDACGSIIDTWLAELGVHWVSPVDDYTETWRINVATQYGGLIVSELSVRKGKRDGAPIDDTRTARITRVPAS